MNENKSTGKVDRQIETQTTKRENVQSEERKREKKMSTAQKAVPVLIVVCVALAVILLATLIAFFQLKADDKQNSSTLEAVYASSYFTMVDSINDLQVDAAKFSSLENTGAQRESLKEMQKDSTNILASLSIMPIKAEDSMSATKFFNQINSMCETYISHIDSKGGLTSDELGLINEMSYVLGTIKNRFNIHNDMVTGAGYSFIDASVFNSKGVNEFSTSLGSLKNEDIKYPTMIFDGPFSASLETAVIKGLSDSEISKEDAEKYLTEKAFKGIDDVKIVYLGETNGDFDTYDFECNIDGKKFDAQVTKREGKLLSLFGYADNREPILTTESAVELAETFGKRLGFENLKCVWTETQDDIAYINLAPIINDVIMYSDLVKVKVDLGGQMVIGFESQNYCLNHVTRNVSAKISSSRAKDMIQGDYKIENVQLAIIPLKNKSEVLTYEVKCEGIDGDYYFYINANNETIEKILKVVDQDGVSKLI